MGFLAANFVECFITRSFFTRLYFLKISTDRQTDSLLKEVYLFVYQNIGTLMIDM